MANTCPNPKDPKFIKLRTAIYDYSPPDENGYRIVTMEKANELATNAWDLNNGHPLDLAPNGKKSFLLMDLENMTDADSALYAKSLVYGEEFKAWFGDWINPDSDPDVSLIVDGNGEPQLLHGGHYKDIRQSEIKSGSNVGLVYGFTDSDIDIVKPGYRVSAYAKAKEISPIKSWDDVYDLPDDNLLFETVKVESEETDFTSKVYISKNTDTFRGIDGQPVYNPITGNRYLHKSDSNTFWKNRLNIKDGETTSNLSSIIDDLINDENILKENRYLLSLIKESGYNPILEASIMNTSNAAHNIIAQTFGTIISFDAYSSPNIHDFTDTLIHELIHGFVTQSLNDTTTFKNRRFSNQMNKLFERAKEGLSNSEIKNWYGLRENASEFASEIMSNQEFKDFLNSRESKENIENKDTWYHRLARHIARLFSGDTNNDIYSEAKKLIEKRIIAKRYSTERIYKASSLIKDIKSTKDTLDGIMKSVIQRNKYYISRGKKLSAKEQDILYNELLKIYESGETPPAKYKSNPELLNKYEETMYLSGIAHYIDTIETDFDKILGRIKEVKQEVIDTQVGDTRKMSSILKDMGYYSTSYANTLNGIRSALSESEFIDKESRILSEKLLNTINKILASSEKIHNDYISLSRDIFAKFLAPMGWTSTVDELERLLKDPAKNISWWDTWANSFAHSSDSALRLIDIAIKKGKFMAREKTLEQSKVIIDLKKKLETAGVNDVEWMFEKDSNGNINGNIVSEYDWAKYKEVVTDFYKDLNKRIKDSTGFETYQDLMENNPQRARPFTKKVAKFYESNTINEEYDPAAFGKYLISKQSEMTADEYKKWEYFNIGKTKSNTRYLLLNKFKGKAYDDIQKHPQKKAYYDQIMDYKYHADKFIPANIRRPRQAPQIRTDWFERAKKKGFLPGMWEKFKDTIKIREDDIEYVKSASEIDGSTGYTTADEKNIIRKSIRVMFVGKLSNINDLSLDLTSTMAAYLDMANNRGEMTAIQDAIEIGYDVMQDRGTFATKGRAEKLKAIVNAPHKKYEELAVDPTGGNIMKKLDEMLDIHLYGLIRKDEGTWLGSDVDVAKSIDLAIQYTAIQNLAVNLSAGINNVFVSATQRRIEAMSNKLYGMESTVWADKTYTTMLPGVMGNIGQRMAKDKGTLFIEKYDILENARENVYNLDAGRKTIFSRLFGKNALFFMMNAGEHYAHTTTALAISNNFRYVDGVWMFRNEFNKPLEALKEARRQEISNAPNNDIIRSIKAQYEPKIKELEADLNNKWKGYTNWWDAHETKDGRIVFKDGFKATDNDRFRFVGRVNSNNHNLHGNYSQATMTIAQRRSIGRLLFLHRRWLPASLWNRFAVAHKDFEGGIDHEGYYNTFGRFGVQLARDLLASKTTILKSWETLTDTEKGNIRKAFTEVAHLIAVFTIFKILASLKDGEDDDNWALNMAAYQSRRLFSEIGVLTPTPLMLSEGLKILKEPFPTAQRIDQLAGNVLDIFLPWQALDEIETGKYKGWTKFQRGIVKSIPPFGTIHNTLYPEEKLKFMLQ